MSPGSHGKAPSRSPLGWSGVHSHNPGQTVLAGVGFARCLRPGDVVAMHGKLGSGKTTFVKGIAEGMGLTDEVSSPTFALIHEYGRPPRLYHMDCYRDTSLERWRHLGLNDYFDGPAISVIEWAEHIAPLLPHNSIHIRFTHGGEEGDRVVEVQE